MTRNVKPVDYFATHSIFRYGDFAASRREGGGDGGFEPIKQHLKAGNLLRIRRGIYAVVPRGQTPETVATDPYVVASHLAEDAVVAFHGALQFHGKAHSVSRRYQFLTSTRVKPFVFRGDEFVPVPLPPPLRKSADQEGGTLEVLRNGGTVRVTTLERAMVDVLHSPRHGGGWEEIWRSLESVEFLDLDAITEYAFRLDSAMTVAKVGFYLEQHREELMVEEKHLERLRKRAPSHPMYLERGKREPGRFLARWNLVVPERVINRSWGEIL